MDEPPDSAVIKALELKNSQLNEWLADTLSELQQAQDLVNVLLNEKAADDEAPSSQQQADTVRDQLRLAEERGRSRGQQEMQWQLRTAQQEASSIKLEMELQMNRFVEAELQREAASGSARVPQLEVQLEQATRLSTQLKLQLEHSQQQLALSEGRSAHLEQELAECTEQQQQLEAGQIETQMVRRNLQLEHLGRQPVDGQLLSASQVVLAEARGKLEAAGSQIEQLTDERDTALHELSLPRSPVRSPGASTIRSEMCTTGLTAEKQQQQLSESRLQLAAAEQQLVTSSLQWQATQNQLTEELNTAVQQSEAKVAAVASTISELQRVADERTEAAERAEQATRELRGQLEDAAGTIEGLQLAVAQNQLSSSRAERAAADAEHATEQMAATLHSIRHEFVDSSQVELVMARVRQLEQSLEEVCHGRWLLAAAAGC